jgi:hypothetical protein
MGGQRINNELPEQDSYRSRREREQHSSSPRYRPTEADHAPTAVPHPQRDQPDYEEDGDFVGNHVVDVVADHDRAAEYKLRQR